MRAGVPGRGRRGRRSRRWLARARRDGLRSRLGTRAASAPAWSGRSTRRLHSRWSWMPTDSMHWPSSTDGLAQAGGPRIITPHPGEFRRLCGGGSRDTLGQRLRQWRWRARIRSSSCSRGIARLITDGRRRVRNTDRQSGHGDGRFGRCADRHPHGRCWDRGWASGTPHGWASTCTVWRATWRPAVTELAMTAGLVGSCRSLEGTRLLTRVVARRQPSIMRVGSANIGHGSGRVQ